MIARFIIALLIIALPIFLPIFLPILFPFAINEAIAQVATPVAQPGIGELLAKMLPMLFMVFIIFYFLVLKPQQVRIKAQEVMLKSLKKGDKVITAAGIIGKVAETFEDSVLVEIAQGVKVKFLPSKILKKIENPESLKSAA